MKNPALKYLTPAMAGICLGLLPNYTHAQSATIFDATFPASWNGTSTTVTDQGGLGNIGFQSGTATYTTAVVPPGAAAGTGSMALAGKGGIKVTGNGTTFPTDAILNNATVQQFGGFEYNIDFMWNGGTNTFGTQKLVDYAGTESLELDNVTANTSALLDMSFGDDVGGETQPVSYTIAANTWYNVTMIFNTEGNVMGPTGDLSGLASLYVNGILVSQADATKSQYGDNLNRPIAIGELAYGHTTSIVGLEGDIYSASVELVPEPSSLALSAMGGLGFLGMIWKARRRKA